MKIICNDRRQALSRKAPAARGISSVSADLDRMLGPKSYEQLEALEKQIRQKLRSDEQIDFDYWEELLKNLLIYKAKAKLRKVSQSVVQARLDGLRKQQEQDALAVRNDVALLLAERKTENAQSDDRSRLDPDPALRLNPEEKALTITDEKTFIDDLVSFKRIPFTTKARLLRP